MKSGFVKLIAAAITAACAVDAAAAAPLSLEERIQERTRELAEQHQPRTAVPLDPGQFDTYAGIYQRAPAEFFIITRQGERVLLDVTEPGPEKPPTLEFSAESPTTFFSKTKPIQISFPPDARGEVNKLVLHASGFEFDLPRVDEAVVTRAMTDAAARIKTRTPQPDSSGKLRRFIEGFQRGTLNYGEMGSDVAVLYRTDLLQKYTDQVQALGALTSLTFVEVTPRGEDKYAAVGEHGRADVTIDLSGDGKIDTVIIGKVETP